ncbi:MAG TPA: hypothetical protein VF524_03740 [Polyangia bacterium]
MLLFFMRSLLWLGVLVPIVVVGAGTAMAAPVDLSAGEREIDDAVCQDFRRAAKWNLAWTATFAIAAVGSAGIAVFASNEWLENDTRAGLYVTAAKATVGVIAKLVDPLSINVEGLCHDRHPASATARHALLLEAAHRERNTLLLNILGGLAVNTAGLLYLGYGRGAWESAWVSFGIGTAVGVASTLTAPVHSWFLDRRLDRPQHIAAVPMIGRGSAGVALTATW